MLVGKETHIIRGIVMALAAIAYIRNAVNTCKLLRGCVRIREQPDNLPTPSPLILARGEALAVQFQAVRSFAIALNGWQMSSLGLGRARERRKV